MSKVKGEIANFLASLELRPWKWHSNFPLVEGHFMGKNVSCIGTLHRAPQQKAQGTMAIAVGAVGLRPVSELQTWSFQSSLRGLHSS